MDCAARAELRGHAGRVVALLAHPARPLLLSSGGGYGDYAVRVWDLGTRALLRTLVGHEATVYGLAACADNRRVATAGSSDRTVRLWDLESGEHLRTLKGTAAVYAVAWDATGASLASGSEDARVRVWDAASGGLRATLLGHLASVRALAAHPEDDLLASGSDDGTVRLWRFSSGEHLRTLRTLRALRGQQDCVKSLAASRNWLVAGSLDKSVGVWSWDGICARVLDGFAGSRFTNSLAWRDGRLAALDSTARAGDDTVHVWDASAADPSAWTRVGTARAASYNGLAVATSGAIVFAAPGERGAIAVFALRAPRERRRIRRPAARL